MECLAQALQVIATLFVIRALFQPRIAQLLQRRRQLGNGSGSCNIHGTIHGKNLRRSMAEKPVA
jgi:hypothetical protein